MIDETLVCALPDYAHYGLIVLVAVAEYWLGKTEKVQAGSMIELLLNAVKGLIKKK